MPVRKKMPRWIKSLFYYPGQGISRDIRANVPYYYSDWKDGINYRVIPSTIYMYFTNLLPAIAFAQDMFDRTGNSYGTNEVLLASALGGIVFGLFSGQPLCIVGVTGPIAIFNYTVYQIVEPKGIPYFPFMAWICLWSMIMHFIIAIFNWVRALVLVTRFPCDIFGFFICIVYIQKGIQILCRQFDVSDNHLENLAIGYYSVMISCLLLIFGMVTIIIGQHTILFNHTIRKFFLDYGLPIVVVFFTGMTYFPGRLSDLSLERLNTTKSFTPTATSGGRTHGWFIHFWDLPVGDVFLAIPFALLLTILFYFDHNVSSLICQASEYPLKKPASFHWDFFLLGITTGVSGILGIPAPNGLIPQAPLHTMSLCVTKTRENRDSTGFETYISEVVEQRITNFGQGLLILGTMSHPLLIVLGLIPQGILAGLFWMMGLTGLLNGAAVAKLGFLFSEKKLVNGSEPLLQVGLKSLAIFVVLQCLLTGAEVGITETIAAVGFPFVLLVSVFVGQFLPKIIPKADLNVLDGPTGSDFTLQNLAIGDKGSNDEESLNVEEKEEADSS